MVGAVPVCLGHTRIAGEWSLSVAGKERNQAVRAGRDVKRRKRALWSSCCRLDLDVPGCLLDIADITDITDIAIYEYKPLA